MLTVRKAKDRGVTKLYWLESYHTFSFGDFFDPDYGNFRALRVLNDDKVKVGHGFDTHPHRNMEIVTYVRQGELEHRDSEGNVQAIRGPGVQRMTAGRGVQHSEMNVSKSEELHMIQVWFYPSEKNLDPEYEQASVSFPEGSSDLVQLASRDGLGNSVSVHQDVGMYVGRFEDGDIVRYEFLEGSCGWVQIIEGEFLAADTVLQTGDGAAIQNESVFQLVAQGAGELLLFDLAEDFSR